MTKTNQNFHHWYPWPKMTKTNQNFHRWYPWPKITRKKQKLSPLVSLAKNAQKTKTFTIGNLGQKWPRKNKSGLPVIAKIGHGWKPWPKIAKVIFWKRVKFTWGQCWCDIPTAWTFQSNFSSNEHCKCFYLFQLVACVREKFGNGKKKKKTSREKAAPLRSLVFLLSQEPFQGSQKPISWHCCTIFAITRKPLKLRPPVRYCKKSFFTAHILR